jgi:hypothetical protein
MSILLKKTQSVHLVHQIMNGVAMYVDEKDGKICFLKGELVSVDSRLSQLILKHADWLSKFIIVSCSCVDKAICKKNVSAL